MWDLSTITQTASRNLGKNLLAAAFFVNRVSAQSPGSSTATNSGGSNVPESILIPTFEGLTVSGVVVAVLVVGGLCWLGKCCVNRCRNGSGTPTPEQPLLPPPAKPDGNSHTLTVK